MKFSFKLLISMMMILAVALGFSGFYFVNYVFDTSLEREVGQALDESSILRFALETAALNVPAKYDILPDHTVEQIASNLETGGRDSGRLLRPSRPSSDKNVRRKSFMPVRGLKRTMPCYRWPMKIRGATGY